MNALLLPTSVAALCGFVIAAGRWSHSPWFQWLWRGLFLRQGPREHAATYLLRVASMSFPFGFALLAFAYALRPALWPDSLGAVGATWFAVLEIAAFSVGGAAVFAGLVALYQWARLNAGLAGAHPAITHEDDGSRFEGDGP